MCEVSGKLHAVEFLNAVIEDFRRDGYAIVPRGLSDEDLARLRAACSGLFDGASREAFPRDVFTVEELSAIVFDDVVTRFLHALLGDPYVLYPNMTVRRNFYTGWHVDQAFSGPGRERVWEPDFCHVSVSVYLQENTEAAGGGIDVVPGTHLTSFDGFGQTRSQVQAALNLPDFTAKVVRAEPRPGDLLVKHARLLHGSTRPKNAAAADERDKFGFSFSAGRHDSYENNRFLSHLATNRIYLRGSEQIRHERHIDTAQLRYPDDFPEQFVKRAEQTGVLVQTLTSC